MAAEDAFLDLVRADVIQAIDESKNAIAMVTERITIANALGQLDNVPRVPEELNGMV